MGADMKISALDLVFSENMYIDPDRLDFSVRKVFLKRLKAMELRVAGYNADLIYQQTGVSNSEQTRYYKRFISLDENGCYWGDRALLPGTHINGYQRRAHFGKKRTSQQGSLSGILTATLDKYPKVKVDFIKAIWSHHNEHQGMKFDHAILYAIFRKLLTEAGATSDEWPFNEKRGGRRSIEKLINKILETDFIRASLTLGQQGATHARLASGKTGLIDANLPFDIVELDAYLVDKYCIINVEPIPGIYVSRVIERFWLLAVTERVSKGILASKFVFNSEVRAQDVHDILIDAFLGDWQPLKEITVEDLAYAPGSGMIGYILPETQGMLWGSLFLDNAMAHHASKIKEKLRNNLGFSINYGQLGHPERRWLVENTFNQIAHKIMHRVPSTTGSGPNDGRVEKPEEMAERYEVFVDEAQQVLDVWVAAYNITPKSGNYSKSPAELLHAYIHNKKQRLIFPLADKSTTRKIQLRKDVEMRTVNGDIAGGIAPHIILDKAKYTNPQLARSPNLIHAELLIKINPDDYRYVEAVLPSGVSLGTLTVLGYWKKTRHSVITRKIINKAFLDRAFELVYLDDIVLSYLYHLTKNANKKNNLEFTRMYYELAFGPQATVAPECSNEGSSSDDASNSNSARTEHVGTEQEGKCESLKSLGEEFWQVPGGTDDAISKF
jgi:hypothetical protein